MSRHPNFRVFVQVPVEAGGATFHGSYDDKRRKGDATTIDNPVFLLYDSFPHKQHRELFSHLRSASVSAFILKRLPLKHPFELGTGEAATNLIVVLDHVRERIGIDSSHPYGNLLR